MAATSLLATTRYLATLPAAGWYPATPRHTINRRDGSRQEGTFPMADYSRFDADQIRTWTTAVFEKLGAPPKDAAVTADALIHADLMGIDSHGLNRLPVASYAGGLQSGTIDPKAK